MNSKEEREVKVLISNLHKCTSTIEGLLNSQKSFIDEYGPRFGPDAPVEVSEENAALYEVVLVSYVDALKTAREQREKAKKALEGKGHIPNKNERKKIRQDAAKNKKRIK